MKGAIWQVFVEDNGGAVDNRTGSCFAQLESAACGKRRFEYETCLAAACDPVQCGSDKVEACHRTVEKGACRDLTAAYAEACPRATELLTLCSSLVSSIAVSCAGGVDGGLDASN